MTPTNAAEDLYETLEVPENASEDEIKKAYRRLSLRLHPDKNIGNPHATAAFQQLGHAYEVLSNPVKKIIYDLEQLERKKEKKKEKMRRAAPHATATSTATASRTTPTSTSTSNPQPSTTTTTAPDLPPAPDNSPCHHEQPWKRLFRLSFRARCQECSAWVLFHFLRQCPGCQTVICKECHDMLVITEAAVRRFREARKQETEERFRAERM